METTSSKKVLRELKADMTDEQVLALYRSGKKMFVEEEIVHTAQEILDYLEPIRKFVVPDYADSVDVIWHDIIADELVGKAIWKVIEKHGWAFNYFRVYEILGLMIGRGIYQSDIRQKIYTQELGGSNSMRTYLSKGIYSPECERRVREILRKYAKCSTEIRTHIKLS